MPEEGLGGEVLQACALTVRLHLDDLIHLLDLPMLFEKTNVTDQIFLSLAHVVLAWTDCRPSAEEH